VNISEVSIRHPVFAWMLMFGLLLFGALAYRNMGVSQNPDVDFPEVSVSISYEGAAPEVMEKDVVDVLEGAIVSIEGIKKITSSSRLGSARVSVEFDLDKNIDVAVQEVQTAISRAQRNLPNDIDPPTVTKSNPEDRPVMWLSVTAPDKDLQELMLLVRNRIQDHFTTVSGVSEVMLGGYVDPSLNVNLDLDRMRRLELSAGDIVNTIRTEHLELPAGRIETATQLTNLRVMGEAENVEEFRNLVIKRRGGSPNYRRVTIADVADVEEGLEEIRRISRVNGEQGIGLGIRKQRGANTVAVAHAVKERLEQVRETLPEGVNISVNFDSSPFIEESVDELIFTIILAALLTALVCWAFLASWSSTVNIILAIPVSIVGTFIVIGAAGFTLNTFTLLALSLAVGIVVDDAIIVLENIVRHQEMGKNRITAALAGSKEILFAVIATTASLISIFLPVAFMEGIIGKYFLEFAVTISVAVALSSVEAITLTPMRCSTFLERAERRTRFGQMFEAALNFLKSTYSRVLPVVLKYRALTLGIAAVFFLGSFVLLPLLPKEFAPAQDEGRLFLQLRTPVGSSLEYTDNKTKEVEKVIGSKDYVDRYFVSVGGFGGDQANTSNMFLTLKDFPDRPVNPQTGRRPTQMEIVSEIRKEFAAIQGIQVFVRPSSGSVIGGGRGFLLDFSVRGPNWDELTKLSGQMLEAMEKTGMYVDLRRDEIEGSPELRIYPDRSKAVMYGVEVSQISEAMQVLFGGVPVALYSIGGQRFDVRVRAKPEDRAGREDISKVLVRNAWGQLIPLNELVQIVDSSAPPSISREDRARAIGISANPAPGVSQEEAMKKVQELAAEILPSGYYVAFSGASSTFNESFQNLFFVLILGIILAYMVLASQFNSFLDPVIVLVALPFAGSGAVIALLLSSQSLNIYSFIGVILLAGLATKNSILLVEFINQLRDRGMEKMDAIIEACPLRLRPVLMTAFSTIAAALPGAINFGPGAETRIPMSMVIIGGMAVSTLFTLVVVPCFYSLVSRKRRDIGREVDRALAEEAQNKRLGNLASLS
jgi:hydrophobe/amphiphile efflux-1 (HAE1) family protein